MLGALARRLFGTANDRYVKSLGPLVEQINDHEAELEQLSDEALRAKTAEFKQRLEDGAELDDLIPEAFATVREAAKRTLGQRHFDVQMMGGIVLHRGMIAEMQPGEGKTLVATLPVYLNALIGKGVHVVTVNDYLAKRDAEWMGQIYRFLGMTVGCIVHELDDAERQQAYLCDVTYGTNNELGFDYLRDNMKFRLEEMCHRPFHYAIVDEVDSILIDEARTPLIISGPTEDNSELYIQADKLIPALVAEEGVTVQNENQTLASITFQNYFRMYPKLAGMTGTAMTEAEEFGDIYKLDVIEIPTNEPCIRADNDDEVYRTTREKYDSVVEQILECVGRQQPVLCGTVSIEKSEALSELLKKKKIPHQVLNARYHEQEAYIIAQAGRPGNVTIATNMAGRGTDIQLGGNLDMRLKADLAEIEDAAQRETRAAEIRAEIEAAREVVRHAGGLFVIGSERHESRRIDNELGGRSGRQGDPGASKFFVSLQDDLMRIFGSERMDSMLQRLGLKEGEAIIHPWVNKALAKAQQKVEARN